MDTYMHTHTRTRTHRHITQIQQVHFQVNFLSIRMMEQFSLRRRVWPVLRLGVQPPLQLQLSSLTSLAHQPYLSVT